MFTEKTVIQRLSFFDFAQFPCLRSVAVFAWVFVCSLAQHDPHAKAQANGSVRWLLYYIKEYKQRI